jgi:hypothetical protein
LDSLPNNWHTYWGQVRIHNLLRQLVKAGDIVNSGSRRWPKWVLGPIAPR